MENRQEPFEKRTSIIAVSNSEVRMFLHTHRVLSPTPSEWVPGVANIWRVKRLCGDDLGFAAQATVPIGAGIRQKDHSRMETRRGFARAGSAPHDRAERVVYAFFAVLRHASLRLEKA